MGAEANSWNYAMMSRRGEPDSQKGSGREPLGAISEKRSPLSKGGGACKGRKKSGDFSESLESVLRHMENVLLRSGLAYI